MSFAISVLNFDAVFLHVGSEQVVRLHKLFRMYFYLYIYISNRKIQISRYISYYLLFDDINADQILFWR